MAVQLHPQIPLVVKIFPPALSSYEKGYAVALIKDRDTIELTAVFAW